MFCFVCRINISDDQELNCAGHFSKYPYMHLEDLFHVTTTQEQSILSTYKWEKKEKWQKEKWCSHL